MHPALAKNITIFIFKTAHLKNTHPLCHGACLSHFRRMRFHPVVGYFLTGTDPYPVMLLDMIKETLQRTKTPWAAQQAAVHAY